MPPAMKHAKPHYAPVKNGKIEYYSFGKGTPIVLVAGYATDISSWDKDFLAALATKHRLIVMNNRGIGGSKVLSPNYTSRELASDINQLIDDLHLQKTALLGISMGGMIAQQTAALYPDKIDKLILINTAIAGDQSVQPSPTIKQQLLSLSGNKLEFYKVAVKNFFPAKWRLKMAYALIADRYLPQQLSTYDVASVIPLQQQLILDWSHDNQAAGKIANLTMPTLILNGEADVILPPQNSVVLAKTIPHAKLQRWKDGGHAMIFQYPTQLANAVNTFLAY